jgi:hypothetical protein
MENSPRHSEDELKDAEQQRRGVAPEASELHGSTLSMERIGQVLISGKAEESNESKPPAQNTTKELIDWQRVATMSRSELLDISEGIIVDSTTLRHVYDTHLVGENGLRRLIYEHMQGGNLQEVLRHEILEHETDFERDPQLRHHTSQPDGLQTATRSAVDPQDLDSMLGKAGLTKLDPDKELIAPKLLSEHGIPNPKLQSGQRRLLDIVLVSVIIILLALVITLAISRS